jgi:hypothetical protein
VKRLLNLLMQPCLLLAAGSSFHSNHFIEVLIEVSPCLLQLIN